MLKFLSIRNYALIESIEIEFENGLNIITGETGAGKSIIIDALSLILGERANTDIVRKGSEKAIIEGIFEIAGNKRINSILDQNEIEYCKELILRREVSIKGQSRCFANDTPITLNLMNQIGNHLVDLHGQHEHQSLLRIETHIQLVDEFGGLEGIVFEFRNSYEKLSKLFSELRTLTHNEKELKAKLELHEFQMKEIDAVNPQKGEEEELENELRILENSEKLFEATSLLYKSLYEGESSNSDGENAGGQSVYDLLVKARNQLEDLAHIDRVFEEPKNECASAAVIVAELTKFIQSYNSRIEFNPERLEEIRERLGQLTLLKKKYGGSLETVIAYREKIGKEFSMAQNFDAEINKLKEQIEIERKNCSARAQRLSSKRRELVVKISNAVCADLTKLGIANAQFDVRIDNRIFEKSDGNSENAYVKLGKDFYETTLNGIDFVEFYLSTNVGEDLKPLVKVASGGEVSRIMLALKTILAKADRLPLLVFDEIDVGISGRIAQAVGKSLKSLSQFHQIIAITHLPQIAGYADNHYVVEKIETKTRTSSVIRKLKEDERIHEVAKLLSGEEVTDVSLSGAKELINAK